MIIVLKHFALLVTLTLLLACSPKYYVPNKHNVPLISKKGETNISLASNGNRFELQGAYGLGEYFAVMLNGGLFVPADKDNGNGGSGSFGEVGGGYYHLIGKHWVFKTYGLLGYGAMENHLPSTTSSYPQTNGDLSANVLRHGIQPNFGFKSKFFTAAISSRFVNLNFQNIEGDLIYNDVDQLRYLKDNRSSFMVEPAFIPKRPIKQSNKLFPFPLFISLKINHKHGYA